jgi:hypothetical protein
VAAQHTTIGEREDKLSTEEKDSVDNVAIVEGLWMEIRVIQGLHQNSAGE